MGRTDSFEKSLMLGKIEGGGRRGLKEVTKLKRKPVLVGVIVE